MRKDLYQSVTDKIVTAIEQGAGDWQMPWTRHAHGMPENAVTGAEYRGVNILNLWAERVSQGYDCDLWASYKQWKQIGAQVKRGEKGTVVVYVGRTTVEDGDDEREISFLKCSHVFNASQVEGYEAPTVERPNVASRLAAADRFVSNTGAVIQYGGDRACYCPGPDMIRMPEFDRFMDTPERTATEAAYGTLFHELTHWTGHESRLARTFGKRFGDNQYAAEELVAELGAAFLCAKVGITPETRQDHAQYLSHWLEILKADKKAIFTAASAASAAADYVAAKQDRKIAA